MKKFKNLPAIFTLLAGFISCVVMIVSGYTLINFLWILICIMLGFYIVGAIASAVINRILQKEEQKQEQIQKEKEAAEEQENSDKEEQSEQMEDESAQ